MNGQIITFYSYKGGVGRSLALANVATLLAQHGKKVLVIDFDLEAPGLHRYLLNSNTPFKKKRAEVFQGKKGTIDFFTEIQKNIKKLFPTQQKYYPQDESELKNELLELIKGLLDSGQYINKINLSNPNNSKKNVTLDFIAAGSFTKNYAMNVYKFNWQNFYKKYGEIFPVFIEELSGRYDYILIDSRTGITDMGSICTMILPEKLVLVFTPNEQSLHGALEIGRQAVEERKRANDLRPLPLFPLISRIEEAEEEAKNEWIEAAKKRFEEIFIDVYSLDECDLTPYFNMVRIPHKSFYAYGELIAAEREAETVTGSLVFAFNQFIRCLECENPNEVEKLLSQEKEKLEKEFIKKLDDEDFLKEQINKEPNNPIYYTSYSYFLLIRGRYKEAIPVLDEVVRRFGDDKETSVREQVARALNGIGFQMICDAKNIWVDGNEHESYLILLNALEKNNKFTRI